MSLRKLGSLSGMLRRRRWTRIGFTDDTIVVMTADHGWGLGE